ncbi:YxeA family protein [Bacillus cereus group sp. MYBK30-1]|uniref:YxeA family protein n=1 Tax=unclassified Bacillus cereus group TaxID=2750818 RepID=UPI003F790298
MKKYLGIFVLFLILLAVWQKDKLVSLYKNETVKEYYVQIQGNEDKQQHPTTNEYKLNAYNKDGEKEKVTFSVFDKKSETPVLLRVNVLESTDSEGNHFVKNYEEVKETELPAKVKDKLAAK